MGDSPIFMYTAKFFEFMLCIFYTAFLFQYLLVGSYIPNINKGGSFYEKRAERKTKF